MLYAQFYQLGVISQLPIEACGDRSVVILDGRMLRSAQLQIARQECRKRGYVGFSLHKGEAFTRSVEVLPFQSIDRGFTPEASGYAGG